MWNVGDTQQRRVLLLLVLFLLLLIFINICLPLNSEFLEGKDCFLFSLLGPSMVIGMLWVLYKCLLNEYIT